MKSAYQMVGHNFNNDRIENDFYATPIDAIEDLIKYENLMVKFGNVLVVMVQYQIH